MKVKSVKISNVLSFEFKKNIEDCQEIKFKDGLNILIGSNGSGKSNCLEIISEVLKKGLFRDCVMDVEEIIEDHHDPNHPKSRNIQRINESKQYSFSKNINTHEKPLSIKLTLQLTSQDFENLKFIQNHAENIDRILKDYFQISSNFQSFKSINVNLINSVLSLVFEDIPKEEKLIVTKLLNNEIIFVYQYLQLFEFIQNCIVIGNDEDNTRNWSVLKNTFSMMGSNRDYNQFQNVVKLGLEGDSAWRNIRNNLLQSSIHGMGGGEPPGLSYITFQLAKAYNQFREDAITNFEQGKTGKDPKMALEENTSLGKLNEYLLQHLNLKLTIEKQFKNKLFYEFNFISKSGEVIPVKRLSSGQRGIIYLIFTIFGFGIKNGLIIIDEPEIHIHPQMQKKYLSIINQAIIEFNIQFILVTHSPVFVNSNTVEGCYRFYLENNYTKILIPSLDSNQRELVRILNYTRATNVLFSSKVVMVEGDSDEYFFKFFFDEFKKNRKDVDELEFIFINGKNYYSKWKKFFDDWKIISYFIRDKDNFGGTEKDIEKKYVEKIFILKYGVLEDYIGNNNSNKLVNVIDFCQNRYLDWKEDLNNHDKIKELENIFELMISKPSIY